MSEPYASSEPYAPQQYAAPPHAAHEPHEPHEPHGDGYEGPATLLLQMQGRADGEHGAAQARQEFTVQVVLRGHFQPIDGHYHWYGRLAPHPELAQLLAGRRASATLHTPQGEADGTLSDPDPWGRYRIDGTSRPPYTLQQPPQNC